MRPVRERKNAFGEIRLKDLSDDRRDSFFFFAWLREMNIRKRCKICLPKNPKFKTTLFNFSAKCCEISVCAMHSVSMNKITPKN